MYSNSNGRRSNGEKLGSMSDSGPAHVNRYQHFGRGNPTSKGALKDVFNFGSEQDDIRTIICSNGCRVVLVKYETQPVQRTVGFLNVCNPKNKKCFGMDLEKMTEVDELLSIMCGKKCEKKLSQRLRDWGGTSSCEIAELIDPLPPTPGCQI